jgi:nucleoside-diphosphate-sugar epimerase
MARCLITGHKGYIGSRLYSKLQERGHEVMGVDLQDTVAHDVREVLREDTDGKFHPHYYDFQPEYIFHLACFPRVGYSIDHPVMTAENNIIAGTVLLNFANKVGSVKRVIYSSSSSVKGNGDGPISPYALQKYTTEQECRIYADIYGVDTVSLRYFNVYSADQPADGPYATAISNWMKAIRNDINPFITGTGEQRRDMVHVDDAVSANIFCMDYSDRFNGEVFEIGTGKNISLNQVKDIVVEYFPEVEFEYHPPRLGDVEQTLANLEAATAYGWQPSISLRMGIRECFERLQNEQ